MIRTRHIGTVSFNMRPVRGPWGGSSLFVRQTSDYLHQRGYRVCYDLRPGVDVIVVVDPRTDNRHKRYGLPEINAYRDRYPRVRVLHRINECDQRKETNFMDDMLQEASHLADHTVFISNWLRDYFVSRWFDPARPHDVIYNGADGQIFHPVGGQSWTPPGPLRIVTHHWSDNPLKGFDVYAEVDRMISSNELAGFQLEVIGRWPAEVRWKSAVLVPPLSGRELADRLRSSHIYLTASRWEPCGMHHVEGAQCGLPLVCHGDGGGIVEAGQRYGVIFNGNVSEALREARDRYHELRNRVLCNMPDGLLMCRAYERAIWRLLGVH